MALAGSDTSPASPTVSHAEAARHNPAELRARAAMLLKQRAWDQAALLLQQLPDLDPLTALQLNLARNMACLQQHRPAVYQAVLSTPTRHDLRIVQVNDGLLSIAQNGPDGDPVVFSPQGDPKANVARLLTQLKTAFSAGRSVALCGLGDGYSLSELARRCWGPGAAMGQTPPIFILESDTGIVLQNLMIHDWSTTQGAIQSPRCHWLVGSDSAGQLLNLLLSDPGLTPPTALFPQGLSGSSLLQAVKEAQQRLSERQTQMGSQIADTYRARDRSLWTALLSDTPPRRPRAMFMTSRFTTVLQHSTHDVAEALERAGWDTRILIERTEQHSVSITLVQSTLIDFQPDIVFVIDHLRHAQGRLIPDELPYLCWIQDDLPHLTNAEAGQSVTVRDFILTHAIHHYTERFEYPQRQCLPVPKLTRVPARPASWTSDGDDLIFVSNASRLPDIVAQEIVSAARLTKGLDTLAEACCHSMIALYAKGSCVQTLAQTRQILTDAQQQTGVSITLPEMSERLVLRLFNHLNNALYRQQALSWIADAADTMGLSLGLHGKGWHEHPTLSRFARGPVAYGPQLEALTRKSKINLQILPYSCTHQRLLDGLVAGGFYLIREHPIDLMLRDVGELYPLLLPPHASTVQEALRDVLPEHRDRLQSLLSFVDLAADLPEGRDPIAVYRQDMELGLDFVYTALPRLQEVCFRDGASATALINRFVSDETARKQIAQEQRSHVERHFTYAAGISRVLARVRELIGSEPNEQSTAGVRACA
jgi:hypothetical protein